MGVSQYNSVEDLPDEEVSSDEESDDSSDSETSLVLISTKLYLLLNVFTTLL